MTSFAVYWDRFCLLLWKNWKVQLKRPLQLIVEVLMPVVYSLILVIFRTSVIPEDVASLTFPQVSIDSLDLLRETLKTRMIETNVSWELAYSPQNDFLDRIVQQAALSLSAPELPITYTSAPNAAALQKYLVEHNTLAGVQFDDEWASLPSYPANFSYALRFPSELRTSNAFVPQTWSTNSLFPFFDIGGPRNMHDADGGLPPGYIREGFVPVQHAITSAFIKLSSAAMGKADLQWPEVVMQRFPYPEFIEDHMLQGLQIWMPMIILLSFMYSCMFTVKAIAIEKEKQLKEVMKIMGLDNWLHWTAWFVNSFLMMGFSAICIVIVLKVEWTTGASVLTNTNWFCLLVLLLVYTITGITFAFMISTFFNKGSPAAATTSLLWFVTYLPFAFTIVSYSSMSFSGKMGCSIFSNTAMGYAFILIIQFEALGEGLQWSNFFEPVSVDDDLTVGALVLMMLVDSLIMLLVSLYCEQILPGEFGVPKKWNFPFTKEFWCGTPFIGNENYEKSSVDDQVGFEAEPNGLNAGIQIKNLSKVFQNKVAVNGISLNIYEDQITVLLGHNGAGKTTTISMLTGMFPPTSGTAIINGCDIRSNIEGARKSLGICPQHNVLFDELSVRDHLIFFSKLRGLYGKELDEEVMKYVKILQLENKIDSAASSLSGGMKRKLSVGAALCGGTKVILCDEPSSGMDPSARRQLWELLQSEKIGRTILLTTHFMDEADLLGDRIAIMSGGDLKCFGSSFFLKKAFASGYLLICVKKDNCDSSTVTELLRKYIPNLEVDNEIGAELTYRLPDEYSSIFERMFADLESNSDAVNLNGYGVTITSLEDVFMKVGSDSINEKSSGHSKEHNELGALQTFSSESVSLITGAALVFNQWKAMFYKKYLYTIRNLMIFGIQIMVPIIFVILTVLIARTQSSFAVQNPLEISLNSYKNSFVLLETASNVTAGSQEQLIAEQYKAQLDAFGSAAEFISVDESFTDFILAKPKKELVEVNSRYLAAATIVSGKIISWLNNQPLHTAPLTLNTVHNAIAKALLNPTFSISIANQPLPYTTDTQLKQLQSGNNLGTQLSSNLCFCMSFVSTLYILFIIKENASRAKLLQYVGGINIFTFWVTQFLWDMFTYLICSLVLILTLACFQEEGFSTFSELGKIYVIFILFGMGALPWTYLFAKYFTEPAIGFGRISLLNLIVGLLLFILVNVLSSPYYQKADLANALKWFFMIFPHYSIAQALQSLNSNIIQRKICQEMCELISPQCTVQLLSDVQPQCKEIPYFGWESPGILPETVYMLGFFLIYSCILLSREYKLSERLVYFIKLKILKSIPTPPEMAYVDADVASEKKRVMAMSQNEIDCQNLVLDRITKYYGDYLAVNQISLAVKSSECFGLLGVNGAGKTTTFKMLTGDETISSGEAYVTGFELNTDMRNVYKHIGYCPQFDALLDDLTGREMMTMYCLIRGVPNFEIPGTVKELSTFFGFGKHIDKQTKAYSGGNKRKLSTALALIGRPAVVYLDEPTTGMDPGARRQLWNVLCQVRDSGKTIVLTSHSMEECEALCTRLAIMVNGEFKCMGSTQHLKNKFSKGIVLKIKLRNNRSSDSEFKEDIENVKLFVQNEFPQTHLQEEYQGILTFHVPLDSIKWSRIFGLMESNRERLHIEDYSISQTTLEEIFLEFAKHQMEQDNRADQAPSSCFKRMCRK